MARTTLRPGCVVSLVNVSAGGALVQAPRPLRPGARVHIQVATPRETFALAAHVVRCAVWSLDADGVIYRGALRFDDRCEWFWEAATRRGCRVPAPGDDRRSTDGQPLPGSDPRARAGSRKGSK